MIGLILAGGKGTRLSQITKDVIPKPMAIINGKPILEHSIERLKENGIKKIIMTVGHLHEKIENYFGNGDRFGVSINYIVEDEPLGSAGALFFLKDKIKEDFIVCSGDVIFDIDIARLINFHKKNNSLITLVTHPNSHPYDSDIVVVDKNNQVKSFNKKNSERTDYYKNIVNAGFFVVNPQTLNFFKEKKRVNMEHDFIDHFIQTNRVYSYKTTEYIKDVGTPERFLASEQDLINGVTKRRNLKNKQKAVFLDRDGVINVYKGFIKDVDEIQLLSCAPNAIKKLNNSEFLSIIVSNQPVIARGDCSFETVDKMFDKIETELGLQGSFIDGIYYCPHHPHKGFEGEIKELKIECDCRKPKPGMIFKAVNDFNLDLSKCYIIGDSNLDIVTGKNAGIKSVRVLSGVKEETLEEADFVAENLDSAVDIILKENEK